MKAGRLAVGLLLVLAAFAAGALARSPKAQGADIPKIPVQKYKLPNGLEVILAEDHRMPIVAVNIWYHVGPANEEPGRTGFAHLFEHMMFEGSAHIPVHVGDQLLERAGASNMNATTDFDRTNYFETVPSNQLELALWIESDRMGYLLEKLDQANLSNQQDVVRNERRQTTENRPYGIVEEALFHELFQPLHPYYADVIGSHADIQAARLEDVRNFFRRYYAPNNASLAVAGDFNATQLKKLVSKHFGTFRSGEPVLKANVPTSPITLERRTQIKDRVELQRVDMAWITPPIFQPGDVEANLTARILGGGKSSRLYKKLVYEKQIAQDVSASYQPLSLVSVLQLQATARPGHTLAELETAIDEEMDLFRQSGPTAAEVEGAANSIESRMMTRLETLNGLADRLNYYNHYLAKPDYLAEDITRLRSVAPAAVRAFAQDQLKQNARVVVECVPGKPELPPDVPAAKADRSSSAITESINPDEPWRNEVPKAAATHPVTLPVPKTFQLPNGLTVIHAERVGMPMVATRLVVRAGSDANPLDKPGLAGFTAAMLDQGTSTRTALQISDDIDHLGATWESRTDADSSFAGIRALKRNFPAALSILADLALHSTFLEQEIARQRASRLASLLQQKSNAAAVADLVMAAALYGSRHPYGYSELGTEASIKAIRRDDMVAFWKKNFVPGNAALIVAGGITLPDLKALVEKQFGAWQAGMTSHSDLGTPATTAARIVLVDKPGVGQTQLRVGLIATARSTPDYAPMQIMNAALGGIFSSRINMNLREEKGYTYGAYSDFAYRRSPGPFAVRAGIRTDVTALAVTEVLNEISRIAATPLSPEELTLAKNSQVLSLPGRFETTFQTVNSLANIFIYDLGADYYSRLPSMLSKVDRETVEAVARKYLVPAKMIVVAVGDRAKIEPGLSKLQLGAIEIREPDGTVKETGR